MATLSPPSFGRGKSTDISRIGTTDSCVSISYHDSWTGRKVLESIGYDYNTPFSSEEIQVCVTVFVNINTASCSVKQFGNHLIKPNCLTPLFNRTKRLHNFFSKKKSF